MPTTITTEVYTLDELIDGGHNAAAEEALDWVEKAFSHDNVEEVSDTLQGMLTDAFPGLRVVAWEYERGTVEIQGDLLVSAVRDVPEGHPMHGCVLPDSHLFWRVCYGTSTGRSYGHSLWLDMNESAPFDWASHEYEALVDTVNDWVMDVENRLHKLMLSTWEELTHYWRLRELADANGYTFTVDGKRFG
jgi:hypothetical protein